MDAVSLDQESFMEWVGQVLKLEDEVEYLAHLSDKCGGGCPYCQNDCRYEAIQKENSYVG